MEGTNEEFSRRKLPPLNNRPPDNSRPEDFSRPIPEDFNQRTNFLRPMGENIPEFHKEDLLVKGDTKPEVHFIGQILGGRDFDCDDGLFCEMLIQVDDQWQLLSPSKSYQTQTCYSDVDEIFVWAHPIDLHFASGDLSGWPKAIFVVWRLDASNKMDICIIYYQTINTIVSYGVLNFPRTKGFHRVECDTWTPMGDRKSGSLNFFLGTFPRLKGREIIAQSLEKREFLNSSSSGKVIVEIEVMMKNFSVLGVSE